MKKVLILLFVSVLLSAQASAFASVLDNTDKAREQLVGLVKNVHVEIAKILKKDGKWVEEAPIPWLSTTYNVEGQRIEEVQIYREQALDFTSVFTRDTRGLLTKGVEYDARGQIAFEWGYTHDETLSNVEEKRLQPDGTFFSKITYHYDVSGDLIEENRFPPHAKNHFRWIYKYDGKGQRVEEAHYLIRSGIQPEKQEKSLNSKLIFVYDLKGALTQETRYNGFGKIISIKYFKYEYDKKGNWISQTTSESLGKPGVPPFIPTEITHRKITYHK